MQPLLSINNLSVGFENADAVSPAVIDLSLMLSRGEILAIVGESGSGKSVTSLSILQLLPSPPARFTGGEILFTKENGETVDLLGIPEQDMRKLRGNQMGMVFQEPMTSLNPVIPCGEQVAESLRLHKKISAAQARTETVEWFQKVKLPDPQSIYDRYPHQLSGGQKQRVMIAMAICCRPALLICDEPTTALDVTVQKTILELLKSLQDEMNMAILFITHDLGVVAEIADRALVMQKGRLVEQGEVHSLFQHPEHPYTRALLACRPILHSKGERLPVVRDFLEKNEQVATVNSAAKSVVQDELLISVRDLSVRFPVKKDWLGRVTKYKSAVDQVSFEVFRAETLGLVGESGCGKTTLGRTLLGLIPASEGSIYFHGENLLENAPGSFKKIRSQWQLIFQDPYSSLNPRMTIGAAIAEPMRVHGIETNAAKRRDKVIELLKEVDLLPEHYSRYPHQFSGGQRQRIVIARALAMRPSFLVCDESVSALDVSVQAQVLNLLNDLKARLGFTVIFISHDLSVVRYFSDRIMVMREGRIVESGDAETVYNSPQSEYTRDLLAAIPRGL